MKRDISLSFDFEFLFLTKCRFLPEDSNQEERDVRSLWHEWGRREMRTEFWSETGEKEPLGRTRRRWRIILKWIFKK
jgi:hypothetical protein